MISLPRGDSERAVRLLRSSLVAAFLLLVAISLTVSALPLSSSPPESTTTTSAHGGATTTTVPATDHTPFIPSSPVTAPHTDVHPSEGCGFAIDDVAVATPDSTKRTVPPLTRRPIGHCRVLLIGDSLGEDIGTGVGNELRGTASITYWNRAKVSSGLVVESFWNWPATLQAYLAEDKPNLVIVCLGGNDEKGIYTHGRAAQFGSPLWKAAYEARIKQVVTEARRAGALVLWVGMPIMRPHAYNDGILTLNKVFLQETTKFPGVTFLSIYELLADAAGKFQGSAYVNLRWVSLRTGDGIHLTFPAEQVVGTYIVRTIAEIYHVPIHLDGPATIAG